MLRFVPFTDIGKYLVVIDLQIYIKNCVLVTICLVITCLLNINMVRSNKKLNILALSSGMC